MTQPSTLQATDRTACAVCADLLATGSHWAHAGRLLVLTGVISIVVNAHNMGDTAVLMILFVLLALGLVQQTLGVRVALDARLFDRLARGDITDLPALDAALQQLFSLPAGKLGRPLTPRIAGARRLYQFQVATTLLLAAANLLIWWAPRA
jgi:hypothetical protein